MNMRIKIADKVSANLAKAQMPKIFIAGGNESGGGASPLNAVGIKFLMEIMDDLEKGK